jgi:hypothetical protein
LGAVFVCIEGLLLADTVEKLVNLAKFLNGEDCSLSAFFVFIEDEG